MAYCKDEKLNHETIFGVPSGFMYAWSMYRDPAVCPPIEWIEIVFGIPTTRQFRMAFYESANSTEVGGAGGLLGVTDIVQGAGSSETDYLLYRVPFSTPVEPSQWFHLAIMRDSGTPTNCYISCDSGIQTNDSIYRYDVGITFPTFPDVSWVGSQTEVAWPTHPNSAIGYDIARYPLPTFRRA